MRDFSGLLAYALRIAKEGQEIRAALYDKHKKRADNNYVSYWLPSQTSEMLGELSQGSRMPEALVVDELVRRAYRRAGGGKRGL